MLRISFITVLACAMCGLQTATAQLALDFPKCHFGDAACTTTIANHLRTTYPKTGLRSINLIPFDPLRIKSLVIEPNRNSPINIALNFKDIELLGLSNFQNVKIAGFTRDVKGPILLEGTIPEVILRGPYQGSGTVLGLPFKGSGQSDMALTNIKITSKLIAKLVTKGADDYLSIDAVSLALSKPESVRFQFGGLFSGNKELGDTANTFINENWPQIFGELQPSLENAFALIVQSIVNNVFSKYPYTEYFLPE